MDNITTNMSASSDWLVDQLIIGTYTAYAFLLSKCADVQIHIVQLQSLIQHAPPSAWHPCTVGPSTAQKQSAPSPSWGPARWTPGIDHTAQQHHMQPMSQADTSYQVNRFHHASSDAGVMQRAH